MFLFGGGRPMKGMKRGSLLLLSITSLIALNLTFASAVLAAPPATDLEQCRNGTAAAPNPCEELGGGSGWVTGNVGSSQAHLVEGYSIPYRAVLTDLQVGTPVTIVLGYDIKHSNKHAIDYITHYDRLEPHSPFGHDAEDVSPTDGVSGINAATDTTPVDPPSTTGTPVAGQPLTSFNALPPAERVVTIFGGNFSGVAANEFQYVTNGSLTAAQSETRFSLTFTPLSSTVVLAWGGHIASRVDWGFEADGVTPRSAGGVSGSPYHMRTISWNLGNLGNQDRSLSAGAVFAPGTIVIVKNTNNEDGTFNYTGSWLDSPSTFAITTSGSTGTQTFPSIVAGTYTVDELALPAGWTFGSLVCSDPTNNTTVSGDGATIVLAAGETVTCTYTNNDPPSTINVVKTANPTSLPEPGGNVTFTVQVTNTSSVDSLTISELSDDVYGTLAGDADCEVGTVLAPAASCSFTFVGAVSGNAGSSHTDIVTACGTDNDGNEPCDTDDATVTITDVAPTITVVKTANPTSLPEPGGNVTFTVQVTNTSSVDSVTITELNDDVFGTLAGDADCEVGTVLAPGRLVQLHLHRRGQRQRRLEPHRHRHRSRPTDNDGTEPCDTDDATVTITDVASTINVARPPTRPACPSRVAT